MRKIAVEPRDIQIQFRIGGGIPDRGFASGFRRGKLYRTITFKGNGTICLFEQSLEVVQFEPYPLGTLGLTLWDMIYCRAKANS